ncbi:UDP-N-acetylmuramoyl-tripeptide--D-alanyl-D-alanine ligase [Sulfurivermis fontis]|uniref:UDP-N-acetylmuramoyl-tripeptide--D-alanyl-D- alanine ligase n=1 Tax=Sulfurivermis fontis TaxID=1972068 RepID=UPI000FD83729|nr:UDP-N-acetylmuramoyl-tripeptide--D-alanyl-D-alanine ligase [Sulfurivermis fontis]
MHLPEGIQVRLSQAAAWLAAERSGADVEFHGVSTDTRTLISGALFIALRGPRFDGHDYVAEAAARGAVAVLVEHAVDSPLPQLVVRDTRLALGRLAAAWRLHCNTPLVAITGSNGKTTVKEMCRAIFAHTGKVLATEGNLNNDIGVPLTLLRLTPQHRYAVVEMGANHAGEIAYLSDLAQPDAAVITNAGPAHLEGFGSVEGVARAKGEIYRGLRENGVAVINADDAYADLWRSMAGTHRQLCFGMAPEAIVTARWQAEGCGSRLWLQTPAGEAELLLPVPGRHNVMNALAATALALALEVDLAAIRRGLEGMQGVAGRLARRTAFNGAQLIDDSYNANPASMRAAIDVLAACAAPRILVVGDMGELGEGAAQLHREIGAYARAAGIDALYAVGPLSAATAAGFGAGARHFDESAALATALHQVLTADMTVLIKGSRSARMERVVEALQEGGRG